MSFVDKFKKILFDDVEEGNEPSEQLPERTPKNNRVQEKHTSTGFIEYHHDDEDTITELKVPKEEEIVEEKKTFTFPQDIDYPIEEPEIETHNDYDDFDRDFLNVVQEESRFVKDVNSYNVNHEEKERIREVKDYRKMLSNENEEPTYEKKPFTNTPVISPVWGILDKNYKPEEIVDRTETLTKVNTGAVPRSYGPVSYNDQPLIQRRNKKVEVVEEVEETEEVEEAETPALKEELVELNTTISDLINDTVNPNFDDTADLEKEIESVIDEDIEPTHSLDDVVIKTDNYDEYEDIYENADDSSIKTKKRANNIIEDAFESTSEFDSINENDAKDDEEEELVDLESIVNKEPDDEDDSGLDNTIETDLFNLIDSMYKDNEDE